MTQDDYNRAFGEGILFGAGLMFLFMLSVIYALQPTPAEQLDECRSIMEATSEHTDQISQ